MIVRVYERVTKSKVRLLCSYGGNIAWSFNTVDMAFTIHVDGHNYTYCVSKVSENVGGSIVSAYLDNDEEEEHTW